MNLANELKQESFLQEKNYNNMTLYAALAHTMIKGPIEQNLMKKILRAFLFPVLATTNRLISTL